MTPGKTTITLIEYPDGGGDIAQKVPAGGSHNGDTGINIEIRRQDQIDRSVIYDRDL